MPDISLKGKKIPLSPVRELAVFAAAAKKKGTQIFHLNIGQPDLQTPEIALEAVRKNPIKILNYTSSNGSESIRTLLANYYKNHNILVEKEDILITIGASEALIFTLGAITDPHDEIIIPEPFYANYNSFAVACGVNIVPVITGTMQENFQLSDIKIFEKKITHKTKAILICNPNNPTGVVYTKNQIRELKKLALKYDLFLIADEVYREFIYDDLQHYSILEGENFEQNGILIDSMSKRFSMCGARIGCVVSKNKIVLKTILKMAQARLSPPTYGLIATEAALKNSENYLQKSIQTYKKRREIFVAALRKIPKVKVLKPQGAFYCIVELPIADTDDFAKWLLEDFQENGQTVMVAPAAGFYTDKKMGKKQIRLAFVLNEKDLLRAVEILKNALEIYKNK